MTTYPPTAASATVEGARCDRPSCYVLINHRPLRCPRCGNTRLVYVELRGGKQVA